MIEEKTISKKHQFIYPYPVVEFIMLSVDDLCEPVVSGSSYFFDRETSSVINGRVLSV
jgi:hypothetical protein